MDCCCLDIQPAASNANGQVAVPVNPGSRDQERPEMKMNRAALLEVFFASAASGIGTIGFVWATVVLLGGFETDLNQVDFWIFGGDWNTDQKILYGLPLDAVVSYMAFSYSGSPPDLAEEIRRSYNFATSNVEDKPFLLYYAHVKKICKAGRITEAINMTLPALAVGSISSNDQQVRVAAIKILHSDELMSKITEFTEPKISRGVSAMTGDDIQMAKTALTVLSRLAGLSGEQGSMMRQLILRNTFLMSSIREVLQGAESDPRLQEMHMRAMEIVDGFALDIESKHHGSITKVLTLLLNVFRRSQNDEIRLAAGKALARLTIESRVLEEMYQIGDDNLIGEHMGAFLGLIMQFIKLVTAADFNAAVNGNGDIIGNGDSCKKFVQKLKSILEKANRQVTDIHKMHPGIRRFTTELVIWMARADPELHCIHHFVDCGMRGALVEAEQTARRASRQENFKLFSPGGVPVLEYEESLHSLASRALELIPEEPNVQ
uniref:Uncharacterized protein n=1 Tax=Leersia perrieri TaxID=77586 RepID=A0A0D9XLA7_9ORYZ